MAAVSVPTALASTFPAATVEAKLRAEFIEAVKTEAAMRGLVLPSSPAQVMKADVEIDSLVTVGILCAVEPIVGFELPDSVVRAGGYPSIEAALAHMVPKIRAEWIKRKGTTP